MVHHADRTGQERLGPCNPDARVPVPGADPDPRPLRGARRARRGGRVRAGGAPTRCPRRAAGLRGHGRTRRWRDPDADGHLAAARRPARERVDHRAVALRQPQHPRWPVRRVGGRARREAPDRLPAAHRRPLRAGRRPRDGGRSGRLPADRGAGHADRPRRGGSRSTRPRHIGCMLRPAYRCTRRSATRSHSTWWRSCCCGSGCAGRTCRRGRRSRCTSPATRCSGSWSSSCAATRWRGRD